MRIDVDPAGTGAAGVAAGELARIVRQVTGRLESGAPTSSGAAALAAWATTWATVRTALLALSTAGEELATTCRAADLRFRQTESGLMVPDVR